MISIDVKQRTERRRNEKNVSQEEMNIANDINIRESLSKEQE